MFLLLSRSVFLWPLLMPGVQFAPLAVGIPLFRAGSTCYLVFAASLESVLFNSSKTWHEMFISNRSIATVSQASICIDPCPREPTARVRRRRFRPFRPRRPAGLSPDHQIVDGKAQSDRRRKVPYAMVEQEITVRLYAETRRVCARPGLRRRHMTGMAILQFPTQEIWSLDISMRSEEDVRDLAYNG